MHRNIRVTLAVLSAALHSAFAFNPIHESSYNLEPRGVFRAGATLSAAGVIDSRSTDAFSVPVSVALKPTREVELGAGLKTVWGGGDDHVPHLVFGVKFLTRRQTTFQADLLVPATASAGKGFSLASHHRFDHGGILSSRLAARLGFMEALVEDDALMAFETAFYPTLSLGRGLSLELGLIGSSQTREFEGNLAVDVQPGLIVAFARESTLQASVALGLAGDRKEEMTAKLLVNHGF
ncbi:MAG TPA: hypothetical protein VJ385_14865 [Fibrobacteria bacterium]|nr:hypothetical protein [Fibrobacteria bacterium]